MNFIAKPTISLFTVYRSKVVQNLMKKVQFTYLENEIQ